MPDNSSKTHKDIRENDEFFFGLDKFDLPSGAKPHIIWEETRNDFAIKL